MLYVVYKRQILLTTGKSNEAKQSNKTEIRKCLICYNNMKNVIRAHFIYLSLYFGIQSNCAREV